MTRRLIILLFVSFFTIYATDYQNFTAIAANSSTDSAENTNKKNDIDNINSESTQNNSKVMTDIHDIKPLEDPGFNYEYLIYFLIIILLIIAAIICFYLFNKYRTGKSESDSHINIEPPHIIAFKLLDRLEKKGFDDGKKYYFTLSAILKGYLNNRFNIDALEKTTEELIPELNNSELIQSHRLKIKDFLLNCDPVKYAGQDVDLKRQKRDLDFAREFINETIFKEEKISEDDFDKNNEIRNSNNKIK